MRVQHRLKRRIVGERLHRTRAIEVRAEERQSREGAPVIELPDRYGGMSFSVRAIRGMASPEPNAPQLIRLVRYPFALERGSFGREKRNDFSLVREERRPYRCELESVLELIQREAFPKPSQARTRLEPRPRPASVDVWLASGGQNG